MPLIYINWNPDPELLSVGSFSIRWYGVLFATGFFIGYFIVKDFFKREALSMKLLDKLATYLVIATVVGARLGHCLFYEPSYYLSNPLDILKVWEGGLASHGGAIGIVIALWLYSRKYNVKVLWILDRVAIPTALAAFFIRMGNLVNSEIFGVPTDLPWGFRFINAYDPTLAVDPRHPTQIYEGLAYLLIFAFLMYQYYRKRANRNNGYFLSMFLILVFTARFFIEFLKEPQVGFESQMLLNMGQILSIPFVIAGGTILYLVNSSKAEKDNKPFIKRKKK